MNTTAQLIDVAASVSSNNNIFNNGQTTPETLGIKLLLPEITPDCNYNKNSPPLHSITLLEKLQAMALLFLIPGIMVWGIPVTISTFYLTYHYTGQAGVVVTFLLLCFAMLYVVNQVD